MVTERHVEAGEHSRGAELATRNGRTVAVTGASAGIGRAIAVKFAREGWHVALIARSPRGIESVKREIESAGGRAGAFPVDVSDADALFQAADEIAQSWGGIDVWVNNAMVTMFAPLSEMSPKEFRRITEVDYLGYVHGTMAALKHMRSRDSGTIIQIGSALSYRAIPLQSAYCGAKFAIRAFTDSLRSELIHGGSRIRLSMMQLPAVNTPQFDWARNRFPRRPRPLPPVFQPEAIAERVYRAALAPPRELWLGFPTFKAIAGAIAMPGFLDRYLARNAYDGQFTSEPAPIDATDNLFEPASVGHVARGRFNERAKTRVTPLNPSTIRAFAALASLSLLAALAVLVWLAI
jgi:NAD(P)-dependent dehydrogenase (short-subunit alcohol dehydrogenase family)